MRALVRIATVAGALWALTGAVRAAEDSGGAPRPGRAAAHAALTDGADLPATPPSLPELLPDGARRTPDPATLGKKAEAAREAQNQADQHANDGAREAREDAANRAAQSSIVGVVRGAAADARAAAAQARTNSAKARASTHPPPPHPTRP
jgi:hypothetical protein